MLGVKTSVYRLIIFSAIFSFFGCQEKKEAPVPAPPPPKEYVVGQFPAEVIKAAQSRYIRLLVSNKKGDIGWEATGVRISKTLAMSNFHVLHRGWVATELNKEKESRAIAMIGPPDTLNDLIIFKTAEPGPNEPLKFAHSVTVGERVANFSNANSKNGFFKVYNVGQVDDRYIYLDRAVFPGESGSGVFNNDGELVGIVDAYEYYQDPDDRDKKVIPTVGRVISYKIIKAYIEASTPPTSAKPRK